MEKIKSEIRFFLENDSFYQESIKANFADDMPLISSGAIDSIGVFNLVIFLEDKYGIKLTMEDLQESNFANLNSLAAFIQAKI